MLCVRRNGQRPRSTAATNGDYLDGEAGDDTINGSAGGDTIYGNAGNDALNPGDGDDFVTGGPGDENVVDGGPGTDTFSYSDGRTNGVSVVLNDGTTQNDGGVDDNASLRPQREALQNFENITGSNASDTLTGTAGANNIQGLAGDDLLDGGLGADTLNGGSGNFDRVTYGSRSAAVSVAFDGQANDGQSGEGDLVQNMDGATGGSGGDKLSACLTADAPCAAVNPGGTTGDVNFDGGAGNDELTGANGNDFFRGGAGADSVVGNGGTVDTMIYDDHPGRRDRDDQRRLGQRQRDRHTTTPGGATTSGAPSNGSPARTPTTCSSATTT